MIFAALGLWAFWIEPARLVTHRFALSPPNWHAEHRGLKIAVLTDLHVGSPRNGVEKLRQVIARTNEERPDLVVILGDLVIRGVIGGEFVEPEPIAGNLRDLRAPLGVFAVLGNHDWWYDGPRVMRALAGAGVTVLENQAHPVEHKGKRFWIVGVADLLMRRPDVEGSLKQTGDGGEPAIIITHNPDIFPSVPPRVSLTLAGHTHGGQVDLPFVGRLIVPSRYGQRYAAGHIVEDNRHLVVGSGVGSSILPVRFRVPPEVAIVTLE